MKKPFDRSDTVCQLDSTLLSPKLRSPETAQNGGVDNCRPIGRFRSVQSPSTGSVARNQHIIIFLPAEAGTLPTSKEDQQVAGECPTNDQQQNGHDRGALKQPSRVSSRFADLIRVSAIEQAACTEFDQDSQ